MPRPVSCPARIAKRAFLGDQRTRADFDGSAGPRREASDDIELVANKSLIASRLSLTPETLSRLFHDLAQEGMISISGRRIKILDIQKMSLIA